jgi:hypothetical protein
VTIRPESERRPESEQEAVVAAIKANEQPVEGTYTCSNDTIVEATGLDSSLVAVILAQLWKEGRIEGLPSTGAVEPYLSGIRRVMPGRPRTWGADGHYKSLR